MKKIKRLFALVCYYLIASRLPTIHGLVNGVVIRRFLCKYIFPEMGANVNVAASVRFGTGGKISIGNNSGLGEGSFLVSMDEIRIGDDVMVGPEVMMLTGGHEYTDPSKLLVDQGRVIAPIKIGNDVWIGARVIILPGVTIGKRVVVGAGSVVTKDLPNNSVCAGVPCKVLKTI